MYRQSPMAAGGRAPIITSRAMPPESPAAKDKTTTPNRSSRCTAKGEDEGAAKVESDQ